jgi:hypothetical protein
MATGQKTGEVYRRYAIVDQAISATPPPRRTEARRFGELLHNELHNSISRTRIAEIVRKIITVRWPRG